MQIHFFKNIESDIAEGSSGSNGWVRVKRERTKARERLLRTKFFYSGHLQHERERPDVERKYMNSDKAPVKRTRVNNIVKWVEAQIYKASSYSPI